MSIIYYDNAKILYLTFGFTNSLTFHHIYVVLISNQQGQIQTDTAKNGIRDILDTNYYRYNNNKCYIV